MSERTKEADGARQGKRLRVDMLRRRDENCYGEDPVRSIT